METDLCAFCDNKSTDNGGPYETDSGEYVCGNCFQSMVERAEWGYELSREERSEI